MDISELLTMLKTDLGISTTTAYDQRLTQYLETAIQAITREGATIATLSGGAYSIATIEDAELIVLYVLSSPSSQLCVLGPITVCLWPQFSYLLSRNESTYIIKTLRE